MSAIPTIDEVIKAGQFDPEFYLSASHLSAWAWVGIVIGFLFALLVMFIGWALESGAGIAGGVVIFIIIFIGSFLNVTEFDEDKWKNQYVIPFYNSIPTEKHEIVFVKIDPEIKTSIYGGSFLGAGMVTTSTEKLTPLIVSYKDDGAVNTYTSWIDSKMTLTKETNPYIEFKRVPKDIDNEYKAGIYEVKVFLPEDYKFTDIK